MECDNLTLIFGPNPGVISRIAKGVGGMFYIHDPAESTYQYPEQVPKIFQNAWPYFVIFLILENFILWLKKKPTARLNDTVTSISHGIFLECGRLICRGSEAAAYFYLYERYRLFDMDWQAPVTWYLALLGVDFCYYWVHRANHEVSILWAQHQVHHSSEDFNLAVGLRQSIFQGWCSFIFYLPLALVIPPAHFLVHQQFNLLYQFWIHTQVVDSLGPLEWVLNTPKHHRVHHGCNLYCLDKNYGGLLIIWDRIFGTFAEEEPKQEIIYGLVFNQPSFNPLFLQVFYNQNLINKWRSMDNWKDKIASVIKGPSWAPGSPWTGWEDQKLDIRSREKFDVVLPQWCNVYLSLHFLAVLLAFHHLFHYVFNPLIVVWAVVMIISSLTVIGMLLENHPIAGFLETIRCLMLLVLVHHAHWSSLLLKVFAEGFFAASTAIWLLQIIQPIKQGAKVKKTS